MTARPLFRLLVSGLLCLVALGLQAQEEKQPQFKLQTIRGKLRITKITVDDKEKEKDKDKDKEKEKEKGKQELKEKVEVVELIDEDGVTYKIPLMKNGRLLGKQPEGSEVELTGFVVSRGQECWFTVQSWKKVKSDKKVEEVEDAKEEAQQGEVAPENQGKPEKEDTTALPKIQQSKNEKAADEGQKAPKKAGE